jgi:hypothetical protein
LVALPVPPLPSTAETRTVTGPVPAAGAIHQKDQLVAPLRRTTLGMSVWCSRLANTASPSGAITV